MCGPHHCLGRDASAPNPAIFCGPLQPRQNSSILEQGCTSGSPGSANRCDQFTRHPWRTSSPLRPCLSFRYTQATSTSNYLDSLVKVLESFNVDPNHTNFPRAVIDNIEAFL